MRETTREISSYTNLEKAPRVGYGTRSTPFSHANCHRSHRYCRSPPRRHLLPAAATRPVPRTRIMRRPRQTTCSPCSPILSLTMLLPLAAFRPALQPRTYLCRARCPTRCTKGPLYRLSSSPTPPSVMIHCSARIRPVPRSFFLCSRPPTTLVLRTSTRQL